MIDRDTIIRMALEAGLIRAGDGWTEPYRWGLDEIEHFAALVAAAERESCALAVERSRIYIDGRHGVTSADQHIATRVVEHCAASIRARSKHE